MNIATLDIALPTTAGLPFTRLSFLEPTLLDGVDTVVWGAGALLSQLDAQCEQHNPPVLNVRASENLLTMSRHWRGQFSGLLARGGTVAVLVPALREVGVHTLQEVMPYDLLEPLHPVKVRRASFHGGKPVCRAGDPFHSFFKQVGHLFKSAAVLETYPGIPILQNGKGQALACYNNTLPGQLFLLPALDLGTLAQPKAATLFFAALQRCIERLVPVANISNSAALTDYYAADELELLTRTSPISAAWRDSKPEFVAASGHNCRL